jgi:hypothetical protein
MQKKLSDFKIFFNKQTLIEDADSEYEKKSLKALFSGTYI